MVGCLGYLVKGKMKVIGVDVGLEGAIACLDEKGKVLFVQDMPVVFVKKGRKQVRLIDVREVVRIFARVGKQVFVMIEKTSPAPAKCSTPQANWGLGYGAGVIEGVVVAKGLKYEKVEPREWQKYFKFPGQKRGQTKEMSYYRASQLFPDVELKTERGRVLDGRADALLIAEYGRRRYMLGK